MPPHWGTLYELDGLPEQELEQLLIDKKITADTTLEDVEKFKKEIEKKGIWDFDNVPRALVMLIGFMNEYPEPSGTIIHAVWEGYPDDPVNKEERVGPALQDLEKLTEWIAKLHEACQKEWDEYDAIEADEEKELEAARKAERHSRDPYNSLFDSLPEFQKGGESSGSSADGVSPS